jgi:hypothetical protein
MSPELANESIMANPYFAKISANPSSPKRGAPPFAKGG